MTGQQAEIIRLDLPASYKHLSVLSACIAEMLGHVERISNREMVLYGIQLAAHEICTNIVEHGYAGQPGGRIEITLELAGEPPRMIVAIEDAGRSFDLDSLPDPDLSQPQVSGYGLFLARNLVDELTYAPARGRNRWRLVKYL